MYKGSLLVCMQSFVLIKHVVFITIILYKNIMSGFLMKHAYKMHSKELFSFSYSFFKLKFTFMVGDGESVVQYLFC